MNPYDYLNTFNNFELSLHAETGKAFDLGYVQELLDLLGSPEKGLKIIHVAGTKGKGSTCAFLAHMLAAAGYKVGLYTSPHLHKLNERIRIIDQSIIDGADDFGGMITDDQLADAVNALRPHIAAMTNRGAALTFFEVMTAAALVFFSRQQLDWVILETGLGGRLDATNAAESVIAVITPISIDHTKILGKTLDKIAAEKSGIIKSSRQRVIIAPQPQEALDVILKRCREFGIPPIIVDPAKHAGLPIALKGEHQQVNAAAALSVVELLRHWAVKISDEAVHKGLSAARWPGRFERIAQGPDVVIDGAHNAASAGALARTLNGEYAGRTIVAVVGISKDKDIKAFIETVRGFAAAVVLTQAAHSRAYKFTPVQAKKLLEETPWVIAPDMAAAIQTAKEKAGQDGVVIITGSIFAIAEARSLLKSQNCRPRVF